MPNIYQGTSMPKLRICADSLISPIESLEYYFRKGGVSIIQAAFEHTYFVHPERVREKTPFYPDRARFSREYYPGKVKGDSAIWSGNDRKVQLDDNQYAQSAWERYTKHRITRGIGYSLRHIGGYPWNPDMFTAGWNFCYMPFWAGMLTEQHHPHPELQTAILQASWDLYSRDNPVCEPPDLVEDPGVDLDSLLDGQPILILHRETQNQIQAPLPKPSVPKLPATDDAAFERVKEIRKRTNQSWSNIQKAVRALQNRPHKPFGTPNVESSTKSCVRRICRETNLSVEQLETMLDKQRLSYRRVVKVARIEQQGDPRIAR